MTVAFDVGKHISFVPVFRETEVEAYFGSFERIAAALNWRVGGIIAMRAGRQSPGSLFNSVG